jgi:hypothetical protein
LASDKNQAIILVYSSIAQSVERRTVKSAPIPIFQKHKAFKALFYMALQPIVNVTYQLHSYCTVSLAAAHFV